MPITLPVFSADQSKRAKLFLAAHVAGMMGRKMEEGDWSSVYCRAKDIPESGWSNLHIDINHAGLGVEQKMVRVSSLNGKPLMSVCGTTRMHPALTRSIRIDDVTLAPDEVMKSVFAQYAALVDERTKAVAEKAPDKTPDMRMGWLLWEDELAEFMYFEEPMNKPDPSNFFAQWNDTAARGIRKTSRSLWIFDKSSSLKRYSVTTSAGIKIQPYFDVPAPTDPNLCYFRVQSEPVGKDTIQIWVSSATAKGLGDRIGSLTRDNVSDAILKLGRALKEHPMEFADDGDPAVPVPMSTEAHKLLVETLGGVSDEHRAQLMIRALA